MSTVGWNNIQKCSFAKQLLKEAAMIFSRTQPNIKLWDSLKYVLKFEFERKLSGLDIHKAIHSLKKKKTNRFENICIVCKK